MTNNTITIELNDENAYAMAKFCQRVSYSDLRLLANNDVEAILMKKAIRVIHEELSEAGFNPHQS
jgi:hypothetical protein